MRIPKAAGPTEDFVHERRHIPTIMNILDGDGCYRTIFVALAMESFIRLDTDSDSKPGVEFLEEVTQPLTWLYTSIRSETEDMRKQSQSLTKPQAHTEHSGITQTAFPVSEYCDA